MPRFRAMGLALLIALLAMAPALAGTQNTTVTASDAWIRVLPGSLPNAGYVTLLNTGTQHVALTGASSAAYRRIMLHQSTENGGVSRMHAIARLPIPPHGRVRLAPGGYHLMLMQPVHPLRPGSTVTIRLRFADGSSLDVPFLARPANATGISD